jgi:hypothetical protein
MNYDLIPITSTLPVLLCSLLIFILRFLERAMNNPLRKRRLRITDHILPLSRLWTGLRSLL